MTHEEDERLREDERNAAEKRRADTEARLADVEADAERYRWLRSQHWTQDTFCVVRPGSLGVGAMTFTSEELDARIDGFMRPNAKVSGAGTASAGLPGYAGDNNGE